MKKECIKCGTFTEIETLDSLSQCSNCGIYFVKFQKQLEARASADGVSVDELIQRYTLERLAQKKSIAEEFKQQPPRRTLENTHLTNNPEDPPPTDIAPPRTQSVKRTSNAVAISTGGLPYDYQTLDTIFAIDATKAGFISGVDPSKAFEGVKNMLRNKCRELGGDAVIFCQFEYRNAIDNSLFGAKQVLEIFAYGTAVRRV